MEQQLHTAALNVPFFLVDVAAVLFYLVSQLHITGAQSLGSHSDGLLTHGTHFDDLSVQLKQLFIKSVSHNALLNQIYR